jgi:hypothetical protein
MAERTMAVLKVNEHFDCEMGRGMFVRLAAITSILEDAPPPAAKPHLLRRQHGRAVFEESQWSSRSSCWKEDEHECCKP